MGEIKFNTCKECMHFAVCQYKESTSNCQYALDHIDIPQHLSVEVKCRYYRKPDISLKDSRVF